MRHVLVFFFVMILFVSHAWAQGFFNSLPDVPLMPGLIELEDQAVSFDKPEGRILMAYADVDDSVDMQSLQSYYQQVLPAFGWVSTSALSYQRADESLTIAVINQAEGSRVLEITIAP